MEGDRIEKHRWLAEHSDILPACFDDGKVTETCRHCHFIYCKNYKQVQVGRRRKEMEEKYADRG